METKKKSLLQGIRILDFSWYAAGPSVTRLLGILGAEVIRIESSARIDRLRIAQPMPRENVGNSLNISGYYNNNNTSKLGVTLNMKHPKARGIIQKLVKLSDVVIDSFSPGVMEKWELTYQDLIKIKPNIIAVSLPTAGLTGPRKDSRGFGNSIQAEGGLNYLTGFPTRPPIGLGVNYTDYSSSACYTALAIMAALVHRHKTGEGQHIEIAQFEATTSLLETAILDYTANGHLQTRAGNRLPYAAPHGAYRCRGNDRWCVIAVFTENEWQAFRRVIGNPVWTSDERFSSLLGRKQNEDELDHLVESWTVARTPEEVMILMQEGGVAAGVVQDAEDLLVRDPQMRARGHYISLNHPEAGVRVYDRLPFRMSAAQEVMNPAPCLGEHNDYVYGKLLGMSEEEINQCQIDEVFL